MDMAAVAAGVVVDDVRLVRDSPYNVTVRTTLTSAKVSWLPAHVEGCRYHHVIWYHAHVSHRFLARPHLAASFASTAYMMLASRRDILLDDAITIHWTHTIGMTYD